MIFGACDGEDAVGLPEVGGSIVVQVSGLDAETPASVAVTGPHGYSRVLTASATLSGLESGTYIVAAARVSSGGTVYEPTPTDQADSVTPNSAAEAVVVYAPAAPGAINLRMVGFYLTQAVQRYDGSVPLVAGRDAYLRVFGLANRPTGAKPQVRVRLFSGTSLIQTYTLMSKSSIVPDAVTEDKLDATWNVMVPGRLVQPGLRIQADIDPENFIEEFNERDNLFPASGTPRPVDVRPLPTFGVRFIPVLQRVNGLRGRVSQGNVEPFLADLKTLLPVAGHLADVRTVYTTSVPVLQGNNGNGAWGSLLSELFALKATDHSSRYYYGVVRTNYTSGIGRIGYIGGGANRGRVGSSARRFVRHGS